MTVKKNKMSLVFVTNIEFTLKDISQDIPASWNFCENKDIQETVDNCIEGFKSYGFQLCDIKVFVFPIPNCEEFLVEELPQYKLNKVVEK